MMAADETYIEIYIHDTVKKNKKQMSAFLCVRDFVLCAWHHVARGHAWADSQCKDTSLLFCPSSSLFIFFHVLLCILYLLSCSTPNGTLCTAGAKPQKSTIHSTYPCVRYPSCRQRAGKDNAKKTEVLADRQGGAVSQSVRQTRSWKKKRAVKLLKTKPKKGTAHGWMVEQMWLKLTHRQGDMIREKETGRIKRAYGHNQTRK